MWRAIILQRAVDLDSAGRRGTLANRAMRTNSTWDGRRVD